MLKNNTSDILCMKCKKYILEKVSDENIREIDGLRYSLCVDCVASELLSSYREQIHLLKRVKNLEDRVKKLENILIDNYKKGDEK